MARVQCPNCGRERVVMDGKRKRCRKCGTPLTGRMAKAAPAVEADTTEKAGDARKTKADKTKK